VRKVVKTTDDEASAGPASVFLETDHGLESMTVESAVADKVHSEAFTGHSDIHFSKEELAAPKDDMGLTIVPHEPTYDELTHHHTPAVLSRGASGPVGQQTLGRMHR
jgi:hypothetical protein